MAHTSCLNDHSMWNGDGKPCVNAYRVGFFRDYMEKHPSYRLSITDAEHPYVNEIYDCVDGVPEEDLDIWYCDECGCLTVFYDDDKFRLDYAPIKDVSHVEFSSIQSWEDYVALRDDEMFDQFVDFYDGKDPLTAVLEYKFKYRYKVSADRKTIYAYNDAKKVVFGYELRRKIDFEKDETVWIKNA